MVCCSLKILDKLEKAKEKERQIKAKHVAAKAAARPFNALASRLAKNNPFANLKVLLLFPKV
jgi:hypothetical protein